MTNVTIHERRMITVTRYLGKCMKACMHEEEAYAKVSKFQSTVWTSLPCILQEKIAGVLSVVNTHICRMCI